MSKITFIANPTIHSNDQLEWFPHFIGECLTCASEEGRYSGSIDFSIEIDNPYLTLDLDYTETKRVELYADFLMGAAGWDCQVIREAE